MTHSFDTEMAEKVGIESAILYQNILFWVDKNEANNKNFINGYYWTYNSYEAWQKLFPYMKLNTIKNALRKLKEAGLIVVKKGLNESNKWDKTNYYRPLKSCSIDSQKNTPSEANENNDEYYTDNKQQIINTDTKKIDEVKEAITYLNEKANKSFNYKANANKKLINAILNQGYTLDDIKKVIDLSIKEWIGTEFEKYIRPSTLFNGKFDERLNRTLETSAEQKNTGARAKLGGYI